MEQEERKGGVKSFVKRLSRWLGAEGAGQGTGEESRPADMSYGEESTQKGMDAVELEEQDEEAQEEGKSDIAHPAEMSSKALTIFEKLAILKKSFEFDAELNSALDRIHSSRELLFYIHDEILFRFEKLRKIGLISSESSQVINSLSAKIETTLSGRAVPDESQPDAVKLGKENIELKSQLEALHAKYVKRGIITETELEQEKEIGRLQNRIRDQHSQLQIARKKLKALIPYHEMAQSLKAKNRLLTSKLNNQTRLLSSLTADNPKHQEFVSTVQKLTEENNRLRSDLEKQIDLLNQLKTWLPDDSRHAVEGLIEKNIQLHTSLEKKTSQLEAVADASASDLSGQIERLSEENAQLKHSLNTKGIVEDFITGQGESPGDPSLVIERLRMENQHLEATLQAKEEQIQALTSGEANRQLMKAYARLQNEYKQVFKENQHKDQLYQHEISEKQGLMAQVRERTALIRENQELKTQLVSSKNLAELLKKTELQCQVLRKERSEMQTKYDRSTVQLNNVTQKLAKITTEYKVLMKEYENIFSSQ